MSWHSSSPRAGPCRSAETYFEQIGWRGSPICNSFRRSRSRRAAGKQVSLSYHRQYQARASQVAVRAWRTWWGCWQKQEVPWPKRLCLPKGKKHQKTDPGRKRNRYLSDVEAEGGKEQRRPLSTVRSYVEADSGLWKQGASRRTSELRK